MMQFELLCYVTYILSWLEKIPEIYRILKRKSSMDFSLIATILMIMVTLCWDLYVFTCNMNNFEMVVCAIIDTILDTLSLIVIFKYHKEN